jgi:hypothetical protein
LKLLGSSRQFIVLLFFVAIGFSISLWAADVAPGEVVAKHLEAIGSAQVRQNLKSRVVQGGTTYRVLVGGSGAIDGRYVFASEGQKSNFLFKINASGFRGEQFIFDGGKISVAGTYSDLTRSEFGNFVLSENIVLHENLLGGVWSASWPLLDIEGRKAKLHAEGTKKVDGKELLVLRYQPRKSTDLDIFLYFDPQTYRHVMTVYKMSLGTSIVGGEIAQASKQRRRHQLEERFSDFRTADGLTLPSHYDLRYTIEMENGFTKTVEWEVKASNIMNNQSMDPRSFQVK